MRPQEEPPNKRQVKTSRYKLWARGYPPLQKPMTVDDLDDETYGLRTQDAAEVEWTETQIREIVGPDARIDKFRSTMPFVSFWWVSLDEAQLEQVEKLHGVSHTGHVCGVEANR